MASKTLQCGQIAGIKCPHCEAVCQRLHPDSSSYGTGLDDRRGVPLEGLAAHMLIVHPEHYEQWCALQNI